MTSPHPVFAVCSSDARFQGKDTAIGGKEKSRAPVRPNTSRVDYPIQVMEGDELRTEAAAASDSAAGDTANRISAASNVAEVSRTAAIGPTEPCAEKSKDATHPPLNKWQTFWTGVLHIDTAKIEPWIAARNALGVA